MLQGYWSAATSTDLQLYDLHPRHVAGGCTRPLANVDGCVLHRHMSGAVCSVTQTEQIAEASDVQ